MSMKRITNILVVMGLLLSCAGFGQNNALFEQGKAQYKAEKYQEAISQWKQILESGSHSAALYFNLGNAHYKLNQIGPSIYYYEKALQLTPNDQDILNNLAFAQNATVDVIEPLPQTFFAKWDQKVSRLLSFDSWAYVAVGCSVLFAVFLLSYYFASQTRRKRLFFIGSLVILFIGITAVVMAFKTYHKYTNIREAIVFSEVTDVKNGPRLSDETIFQLHEGTKVQILLEEDNWYRISLLDGKDGWMPISDLKEL